MSNMEVLLPERSVSLGVDIEIPSLAPRHVSQSPSPVEEISLLFAFQIKCSHLHAAEDGVVTFIEQHESPKLISSDHRLPVDIFNHGDDTLHRYLSWQFTRYGNALSPKPAADELIKQWVEIREEVNSNNFGKVFPFSVTLTIWQVLTLYERPSMTRSAHGMVPASTTAINEMLKRVKAEETEGQSCVICLEDISKEGRIALQMPCLHVFHGNCIEKWLKRSHYCPICRFQMPTH